MITAMLAFVLALLVGIHYPTAGLLIFCAGFILFMAGILR